MSHDASATWSGFNYQGKVALYHTLTLINRKLQTDNNYNFNGFELILENHEDFDIKGTDGFISFHQVKAINKSAFNTYENALFAMILQLDNPRHTSVEGYLHTWKSLNWNGQATFEEKLKGIIKKITDSHEDDPDDSIISKAFTNNPPHIKMTKIIKQAKNEDDRMTDVENVVTILDNVYASNIGGRVTNRIRQYAYGDDLSCNIDAIDIKVKREIRELHNIKNIASNDEALDKIFCTLLAKLDENVISKHINLNEIDDSPISFIDIIRIVVDDEIRDSDEAYLASRFKLQFMKAFEEFLDDEDLCSPDAAEAYSNGNSNLNVTMGFLLNLQAGQLFYHFKNMNPHISFDTENTIDNALKSNIDDLRQYLFTVFRDMCSTKLTHKQSEQLILYKHGTRSYLPTTIGAQTQRNLVRNIMENSHAIPSLFEVTAILSGCEHAKEINCFAEKYSRITGTSVSEYYIDEQPEDKEKITQISRNIRLIKVSTAIEEINNA